MKRKLTATAVKNAKPNENGKPSKKSDGGGLHLLVKPAGKYWRYSYRYNNKQKTLPLGIYPDISLIDARDAHRAARSLLAKGIDPAEHKKAEKIKTSQVNTFEQVAREWWEKERASGKWSSEKHQKQVLRSLELNIFPELGDAIVSEISSLKMLEALKKIESRGKLDHLRQIRQRCSNVFIFAIASGRAENNPVAGLEKALQTHTSKNHAAFKAEELPAFLRVLDQYQGTFTTTQAIKIMMLTFTRTTELRVAQWSEIDFKNNLWSIPAERMKKNKDHLVPLSNQAILLLEELQELTGNSEFLFPQTGSNYKAMSNNTMLYALYRMGFKNDATIHGMRTTASTILNESGFNPDAIERQLSHVEKNQVRGVYNKAEYLPERIRFMQWWADYLDTLRDGAQIIPINRKLA